MTSPTLSAGAASTSRSRPSSRSSWGASRLHPGGRPARRARDRGPDDILKSWHVVERLRDKARERGIFTPHLPEEWGGLGVGILGMSLINQACGVSGLASLGLNAMAPDEGNMHTLLIAGDDDSWRRSSARSQRAGRARALR